MPLNKVYIEELMEKKQILSQKELAEKIGISHNQLSVMLSSRYEPVKSRVVELSNFFDVSPVELLDKYTYENTEINFDFKETSKVTAIELFAGAGGIALGLEQAGIETKLFNDNDKYCGETLRKNRPDWNVVVGDISNISFEKYKGKIDVVTGGFPCQAFSYAGKKLGFEDTRGTLFYEFARCVKEVEPLLFMAENVRGLISHDKGKTLETILSIFTSLGYNVKYKLLNSVEYGVPQKRQRVVIIGTKDNINFSYPDKLDYQVNIREALKDVPDSPGQSYSENKKKVLDLVPPGGYWRDLPEDIQKSYMGKSYYSGGGRTGMARRMSWDEPSLTLTCSPSQKQTERCHPEETRPFTVREYARIQTFPDNWLFSGPISQQYKQIGNAVPVELARLLGLSIKNAIINYKNSN